MKTIFAIGFCLLVILWIFLCSDVEAQETATWKLGYGYLTLPANTQDTLYISFPPADGIPGTFFPSTTAFTMPERVKWNGNVTLEYELYSGATSDSAAGMVKSVNREGEIMYNRPPASGDSAYFAHTALSGAGVNVGDGRAYGRSLTGLLRPSPGLAIIFKNLDLTGGTRVWRFRLIVN